MVAGDALTSTNLNLILNAFNTYQLSVPEPSTWVMMLLGFGGAVMATYLKRRERKDSPMCATGLHQRGPQAAS